MQQESQDTHVGQGSLKTGSQPRVVKVYPERTDAVRLSTVPDKDGYCRDLGEEDCRLPNFLL